MKRRARVTWAVVLVVAVGLFSSPRAFAQMFGDQFGGGNMGGMGRPSMGGGPGTSGSSGGGKKPSKKKSNEPETHAASGASDEVVPPGTEPTLPAKPLEIPDGVKGRIGSDASLDEPEVGRGSTTSRHYYGLWYDEHSDKYGFRTLFPLWLERTQPSLTDPTKPDRASLFGGIYYNRRSAEHSDDVLFPLVWNLAGPKDRTTIVGPFVNRRAPGETDNWFAPLYFTGTRPWGGYTVIPPLLTYLHDGKKGGFNLVGPMFCTWKGGDTCDTRTAKEIDLGFAPFYFHGQSETTSYDFIPPLLHYHGENQKDESSLDIWGPYFRKHTEKRDALHVFPLYYSLWGANERHTTFLPLFHYGWKDNSSLFVNPLFLLSHGEKGESTFITYLYARHRGRTSLDMITPFYWHVRDPDIGLDEQLLFPFLYTRTSPRESNTAFFPFWGHFERYGISESTWITPFFQHSHDLRGWDTNIHPILYVGRNGTDTHTVVAPFFFDFASLDSRVTVGFPVYWRFTDETTVSQLVANTYYHEKKVAHGLDWEVHIFPAFSYGETPNGHWWNFLYGLAGYTRRGDFTQIRTLWIPITLSGDKK
ncbi:MAG TPA: hypothetical protein VH062_19560 [Polyangiaceae bacterium]|nr:hypothetical protein [Polyangiaceae bacterium]